MPPVGAAIGAAATALSAAAASLGAAISGNFILQAFVQAAIGVALTAISRAMQSRPDAPTPPGTITTIRIGEDQPQTFALGRTITAGGLAYGASAGESGDWSNAFYSLVIEFGDLPMTARRFFVNGEWVTLSASTYGALGRPVIEYRRKGRENLWFQSYDGTQTAADPYLVGTFQSADVRPWDDTHVGTGIPYVVVTARFDTKVHRGLPKVRIETDGVKLYDVRKDSTAGGSGAHRLNDPATWETSRNPWVHIYNILLGIRDPYTGDFIWGGQGIVQADLPAADWIAAMNEADARGYKAGLEIATNQQPADVIDELKKAALGELAEAAGYILPRCGPPNAAVYAFSDDDIIVSEADLYQQFPSLDAIYTAVAGAYPEPEDGYETRDAPLRIDDDLETRNNGSRRIAALQFPAVSDVEQVQKLMKAALKDEARFRRHSLVLPPEARALAPLDAVTWDSARNGYESKLFTVEMVEHLENGLVAVSLRETDPDDYDWNSGTDLIPTPGSFVGRPAPGYAPTAFAVYPFTLIDAASGARKPAVRLAWNPDILARGVKWQMRVKDQPAHSPVQNSVAFDDDEREGDVLYFAEGEPLRWTDDEDVIASYTSDVALGELVISEGVEALVVYQVRAGFDIAGVRFKWSDWLDVTAPDVRIQSSQLEAALSASISTAIANANQAVADLAAVDSKADQALALATDAANATGVVGRLMAGGWLLDPSFDDWTSDVPDSWTEVAGGARITEDTGGYFNNSAAGVDAQGSEDVTLRASHGASQFNSAANLDTEFVVMSIMLEYISGDLDAGRAYIEWRESGGGWETGGFPINDTTTGRLDLLGFTVTTGARQIVQVLMQKPDFTADDMALVFVAGTSGDASPLEVSLHSLDIRAATATEVDQVNLRTELTASISSQNVTFLGITDALASRLDTVEAEADVNAAAIATETTARANADTALSSRVTTLEATTPSLQAQIIALDVATADEDSALAARLVTVEARPNAANVIANGQFLDGIRPAGELPGDWEQWPSGAQVQGRGQSGVSGAMDDCPARYAMYLPNSASSQNAYAFGLSERTRRACEAGERFTARFRYATGGSSPRSATLQMVVDWYGSDGASFQTDYLGVTNVDTALGTWGAFDEEVAAPAGATSYRLRMRRAGGGSQIAFMTDLSFRLVDPGVRKRLDAVIAFKADAGNPAELLLVSTAEPGLPAESIARIRADNILLDGTVGAKQLVIGDFSNLVPDDQLQDASVWQDNYSQGEWELIPTTTYGGPVSKGELRWTEDGGAASVPLNVGPVFPVVPGDELACSCAMRSDGSGDDFNGYVQIRFYDADGATVETQTFGNTVRNNTGFAGAEGILTVPSGAKTGEWRWRVNRTETDTTYIRFFSPVVRRRMGAVDIRDGAITADKIQVSSLDAISANIGSIQVGTGNFENLSVNNSKIADNAVSRIASTYIESNGTNTRGSWVTIASLSITRRAGNSLFLFMSHSWSKGETSGVGHSWRFRRDSTTVKQFAAERADEKGQSTKIYADSANVSGAKDYALQVYVPTNYGTGFLLEDISFYIHEISK